MKAGIPMSVSDEYAARGAQKWFCWARASRQRSVWQQPCKPELTVGLLRAAINHGDLWLGGHLDKTVLTKTISSLVIGFVLVRFSATATWVQKTLKQQGVPLPGHTTN